MQGKKNCKLFLGKRVRRREARLRSRAYGRAKIFYPHLESPQLRHVTHLSMRITALVEHLVQSCASAGNSPVVSTLDVAPLRAETSARFSAMNCLRCSSIGSDGISPIIFR